MQRIVLGRVLAAVLFLAAALNVSAQGTAISYQGRLNDGGAPANTNYDFRFAVFNAPTNGAQVSFWLTNDVVPVSNGLFSVTLDFGPGVFDGTSNGSNDWMDVAVRKSGGGAFTELVPRQPILPVPYALFATSASNLLGSLQATQLVGTLASSVFPGTYSNGVDFVNATNIFTGTFIGNGANLTSLNASQITGGTLADARLQSDVALLDQSQTFTAQNTFNSTAVFNNTITSSGTGTFTGVNTFTNNNNSFTGNFYGNGLVGWAAVGGTSVTAVRDHGYMLQNAALTTVTLPASGTLTPVDIVRISGAGTGGWKVQENSGQSIIGNFACYSNSYVAQLSPYNDDNDDHCVAASADGIRMYAGGYDNGVWESSDSGETWTSVTGTYFSGPVTSVACSANGQVVYAEPGSGNIEKSTDFGVTWSAAGQPAVTGTAISCPADGSTVYQQNIACSGNGTYRGEISSGSISLSINSSSFSGIAGPAGTVTCLAVSSDCTKILAGINNGYLYASANQGATWTVVVAANKLWKGAWMSPDGSKFAAAASATTLDGADGGIYRGNVIPLANTISSSGTISGSQGSAVELQFIGSSQFMPVSSTGLLWAN